MIIPPRTRDGAGSPRRPRIVAAILLAAALAGAGYATPAIAIESPTGRTWSGGAPHEQLAPLRAEQAWQRSTGSGVTVAVLDSGVDAEHPGLAGNVLPGSDYVDGSTDGRVDPVGHGTAGASLLAGHDGATAIGLAPDATILPVRVLDDHNRYQDASTVAAGLRWAVEQGAQVINLSLGGERRSATLNDAITFAMANDVVVVACTGNADGDSAEVWYPAREPGVVAVTGLDSSDTSDLPQVRWLDALTGPETVLAAPAILTGAQPGGGYGPVQGTSFGAALVTATATLIRARWPDMSAGDVVNRLVATAEDLGDPGRDQEYGFGAVDPLAALSEDLPRVHLNPLDTKIRSGTAGFGPAPHRSHRLTAAVAHLH